MEAHAANKPDQIICIEAKCRAIRRRQDGEDAIIEFGFEEIRLNKLNQNLLIFR